MLKEGKRVEKGPPKVRRVCSPVVVTRVGDKEYTGPRCTTCSWTRVHAWCSCATRSRATFRSRDRVRLPLKIDGARNRAERVAAWMRLLCRDYEVHRIFFIFFA